MNPRQAGPGPAGAGLASAGLASAGAASTGVAQRGAARRGAGVPGGAAEANDVARAGGADDVARAGRADDVARAGRADDVARGAGADAAGEPGGLAPLVSAWRSLAARHAAVSSALEHELGQRHGLGVSEFEVLERLVEDKQHKFRVQELAESVHLSQSTLSRLIARLEQHGLVQRNMCDADRRGIDVCLTEAGRQRHAEAQPTHRAVLEATLPPS